MKKIKFKVRTLLIPASLPIISLAIADVVLALATMPLGIAANMSGRWLFGVAVCNWYGFSHTVVGLSSILHHAIIAFERCMTIYQPLKMHFNMHRMLTNILLMNPVICFFWYRRFREGTKKLLTKKRSGALQDGRRGCSQTSIVWHTTCSRSRVFLKGISSRSNHFKTVNGQDNAKGSKGFPKDD